MVQMKKTTILFQSEFYKYPWESWMIYWNVWQRNHILRRFDALDVGLLFLKKKAFAVNQQHEELKHENKSILFKEQPVP